MKNWLLLIGEESDILEVVSDSCEAMTLANHFSLVPRGGHWAPIAWGGGVIVAREWG
jgi:hypothetical protein